MGVGRHGQEREIVASVCHCFLAKCIFYDCWELESSLALIKMHAVCAGVRQLRLPAHILEETTFQATSLSRSRQGDIGLALPRDGCSGETAFCVLLCFAALPLHNKSSFSHLERFPTPSKVPDGLR